MEHQRTLMPGDTKILGVPKHLYTRPLWWNLRERKEFSLETDVPANLAINLRYHRLHAALLSPIDYARDYAMYRIVPHTAVSSRGESKAILLAFNKGLRSIESITIDPSSTSEIVLTRLVLTEKYDVRPTFVPSPYQLHEPSPRTDATLFVGDPTNIPDLPDTIDLVDEWTDMTDYPYVHSIWVSRESELTSSELNHIMDAGHQGAEQLSKIVLSFEPRASESARLVKYLDHFGYSFNSESMNGLLEFLRMAYYHGILQDIPDVKLHAAESQAARQTGSEKNPSLN